MLTKEPAVIIGLVGSILAAIAQAVVNDVTDPETILTLIPVLTGLATRFFVTPTPTSEDT